MTRPVVALAALLLAVGGCTSNQTVIDGTAAIETRQVSVTEVTHVHVGGSANVKVTAGTADTAVALTGPADVLDAVDVSSVGGKLTITTKPGYQIRKRLDVDVRTPKISGVGVSGSANVGVTGVSAETFEVGVSGSAVVKASGIANKATVGVSGSAEVDLLGLTCDEAKVAVSGSADVKVTVVKSLSVGVSGAATVQYRGDPTQVQSSSSGSAKVIRIK